LRKAAIGASIGLAAALLALAIGALPFAETIELKTYDWRMRATADPAAASRDIVLIAIDDASIEALEPIVGQWPWPRLVHAALLDFLARARPRIVLYDVFFTERDRSRFMVNGEEWTGAESDAALARSAGDLGVFVALADTVAEDDADGHDARLARLPGPAIPTDPAIEARPGLRLPFAGLLESSAAVAHNFSAGDADGVWRRYVPLVRHDGHVIPSLALAGAMATLGLGAQDVRPEPGGLRLGDRVVPLVTRPVPSFEGRETDARRALIRYLGAWPDGRSTFETFSFYELFYAEQQLLAGEAPVVDPARLRDRIVVVGATAAGLHDVFSTPLPGKMPGPEMHATMLDNMLAGRFLSEAPVWAGGALVLAAGVLLGVAAVYLSPWWAAAAAVTAAAALVGGTTWLFARGLWTPLVMPLVAAGSATFGGAAYQYFVEGREKRRVKQLFSRYVSKDVYDQLIASPDDARLGGQRRHMTVLFSDIRGFTSVSERGEPEEIVAQLNEYFSRMVPVVFAHRGTIDKFVGDMIMALFGAPLDDPDHADHAVEAALAMTSELAALNRQWMAEGRPALNIGIGISTGDMVAGNLGSESIMSYTVIGDVVNLGARLESLNKEFGTNVIISEATRQALKGRYDVRALGEVTVKGKSRPVQIHAVVPPAEVRDGLNPGRASADIPGVAADAPSGSEEQATS
jgi:adenylate cyclase